MGNFALLLTFILATGTAWGQDSSPTPTPAPSAAPTATPTPAPTTPKSFHANLKEIDNESRRAVAEMLGDFSKINLGTRLVAIQNGQDCFFTITSIKGNIAQLDALHCQFLASLSVGWILEISYLEPNAVSFPEPKEESMPHDRLRFAVVGYYGLGATIQSDNISVNTNGVWNWGAGSMPTTGAPGVAVEVFDSPKNSFGWEGGLSYDFQRSISGLNANAQGQNIGGAFNTPQPMVSFLTFYANGLYRFKEVYFTFGLNLTFPNLQGGSDSFGTTTFYDGVGLQMGMGYNLSENFALEFWLQSLSFWGNSNTPTESLMYNDLYIINPEFRFRFSF